MLTSRGILPVIKTNVHQTPMTLAFLAEIFSGKLAKDVTHTVLKDIITDLVEEFSLRSLEEPAAAKHPPKFPHHAYTFNDRSLPPQGIEVNDQTGRNTATVLCKCLEPDLRSEMLAICGKLQSEAEGGASSTLMQTFYIPCLKETFVMLQNGESPPELQALVQTVQTVQTKYYAHYVGEEPQRPANWTRSRSSCSCNDCQPLNIFLESPHQRTGSFSFGAKRRAHLHNQMRAMTSLTHETGHVGKPQVLIVTKTNSDYEQQHQR